MKHPKQLMPSERYAFARSRHFVWSGIRNPTVNIVLFKVSRQPPGAPNLQATEHSYYIWVSFRFFLNPANTSIKNILRYIVVYLVKLFAIATAFQDFTFTVELQWLEHLWDHEN